MEPVSETPNATVGFSIKFSFFTSLGWLMNLSTALGSGAQSSWAGEGFTLHTDDLAVTS